MARIRLQPLFIGVGGHAVAIDNRTGEEIWRTKVKSSASFVTISLVEGQLLVGASGELFCLNPKTGEVLWHNKLKGLGLGVVAFTGTDATAQIAAASAAAAATTAATM